MYTCIINDKGIAKILYGRSLCNVEIHAVMGFGCEVSLERGTSLQNSCVDDSHSSTLWPIQELLMKIL